MVLVPLYFYMRCYTLKIFLNWILYIHYVFTIRIISPKIKFYNEIKKLNKYLLINISAYLYSQYFIFKGVIFLNNKRTFYAPTAVGREIVRCNLKSLPHMVLISRDPGLSDMQYNKRCLILC